MQKYAHSQIDANTKTAHFHDEFKVQLPASLLPEHHLLFTFFHVDLQMKLEAPKPVCYYLQSFSFSLASFSIINFPSYATWSFSEYVLYVLQVVVGYAVLPLLFASQ